MLFKTHVVMTLFSILFLIEHVEYKFAFFVVALVAGILPEIESGFSRGGSRGLFKSLNALAGRRGFFHSLTFCIVVTAFLSYGFPIYALPFFLGYSLHLFADSFTVEGIRPFWPLTYTSKGPLKEGSAFEHALFVGFCIVDLVLIVNFFL